MQETKDSRKRGAVERKLKKKEGQGDGEEGGGRTGVRGQRRGKWGMIEMERRDRNA